MFTHEDPGYPRGESTEDTILRRSMMPYVREREGGLQGDQLGTLMTGVGLGRGGIASCSGLGHFGSASRLTFPRVADIA